MVSSADTARKVRTDRSATIRATAAVRTALQRFLEGLVRHARNLQLRSDLLSRRLSVEEFKDQAIRVLYRLFFLALAEGRGAMHADSTSSEARQRYGKELGVLRLIDFIRKGGLGSSTSSTCWQEFCTLRALLGGSGDAERGVPALGSELWACALTEHLEVSELADEDFLSAIATLDAGGVFSPDQLGPEGLGRIYEHLLEVRASIDFETWSVRLESSAGNKRRTSGAYYTPSALVERVLEDALEPVVAERLKELSGRDAEAALLGLKICDPAVGSGHFLVAAARRLARHLANVRSGSQKPSSAYQRQALADVIAHCVYGVDSNPLAVELAKVTLWMESIDPGKPLGFLDQHLRCGNALLGVPPPKARAAIQVVDPGAPTYPDHLPDSAFERKKGDDRRLVQRWKCENELERTGLMAFDATPTPHLSDEDLGRRERDVADAWCAAFFLRKASASDPVVTEATLRALRRGELMSSELSKAVRDIAARLRFFHWELEFPEVFAKASGFDVILGNPPWERLKLQELEWFSGQDPGMQGLAHKAARRERLRVLKTERPELVAAFETAQRDTGAQAAFLRNSGRYPLTGRGDVNTYAVFAETFRHLVADKGRVGCLLPSGLATDDTTKHFFHDLVRTGELVSFFDFENRYFSDVHASYKFALVTLAGSGSPAEDGAELAFFLRDVKDLVDPRRRFRFTARDFDLVNPNTKTSPICRNAQDAAELRRIHQAIPVLWREGEPSGNPWGVRFLRLFDMAEDSGLFRTWEELEAQGWSLQGRLARKKSRTASPLYEAKMIHQFQHRHGDWADAPPTQRNTPLPPIPIARLQDPNFETLPRYWVPSVEVEARLSDRWQHPWLLGWRDICRSTDERTLIATVIPRTGVGDKLLLLLPTVEAPLAACLLANLNSLALDAVARQKLGGTSLKYFVMKQLPILAPEHYGKPAPWDKNLSLLEWMVPRVVELVYTAADLEPFARECGHTRPPYLFNEERRAEVRAELDAAYFHLYGYGRAAAERALEAFPLLKKRDLKLHVKERTRLAILNAFDRLNFGESG